MEPIQNSLEDQELPLTSAAAYVRMSTEHQQYSTSNQMDVIREYAKRRGMQITKDYSDAGKSGLNIEGREALAQMIQDVQDGKINCSSILVYDVSRWGRFQDADESLPSSAAFSHRFGSLISAYQLIGYDPKIDYSFIEINRKLRKRHPEIVASVVQKIEALGAKASWDENADLLWVNNELRVSIVLCRHTATLAGSSRWLIRLDAGLKPDITIAVRMDATNEGIRDYYVLPGIDMMWENLRIAEANGIYLDTYRFDTLDFFFGMAERVNLEEAI